ncbi:hypothetical protein V6Z11_D02G196600 [Gossypium hirsutum]
MTHVSDIKLIRTDTTLDLSQKAEKGISRILKSETTWKLNRLCISTGDNLGQIPAIHFWFGDFVWYFNMGLMMRKRR